MKGKAIIGGLAGIACMASVAFGQEPFDEKLQAATYNTKLVQAMDECAVPTTVISGLNACAPANTATDGTDFSVGKLLVKSKGGSSQVLAILKSSGNALNKKALAGKDLRVQLTLRVTRRSSVGNPAATFSDVTVECGSTAPPVPSNGNFLLKTSLGLCGLPGTLAADGNLKEIVAASVIDDDNGFAVAVPGVRKK